MTSDATAIQRLMQRSYNADTTPFQCFESLCAENIAWKTTTSFVSSTGCCYSRTEKQTKWGQENCEAFGNQVRTGFRIRFASGSRHNYQAGAFCERFANHCLMLIVFLRTKSSVFKNKPSDFVSNVQPFREQIVFESFQNLPPCLFWFNLKTCFQEKRKRRNAPQKNWFPETILREMDENRRKQKRAGDHNHTAGIKPQQTSQRVSGVSEN